MSEVRNLDEDMLLNTFTRMSSRDIDIFLGMIGPETPKEDITFRQAISESIRLAVKLRFLALRDSYRGLMDHFIIYLYHPINPL